MRIEGVDVEYSLCRGYLNPVLCATATFSAEQMEDEKYVNAVHEMIYQEAEEFGFPWYDETVMNYDRDGAAISTYFLKHDPLKFPSDEVINFIYPEDDDQ